MKSAAGLIRIASIVLTAVVAVSFGMFVWDELGSASKNQANLASPTGQQVIIARDIHGRLLSEENGKVRVKLDQANDSLTSPGEAIGKKVGNGNSWTMRGFAFIFGMLVFLVGLRLLASWVEMHGSPGGRTQQGPQQGYTAGTR